MFLPSMARTHNLSPRSSSSGSELVVTVGTALISLVVFLFFILMCVAYYRSTWSPRYPGQSSRTVIPRRARPKAKRVPVLAKGIVAGLPIVRFEEKKNNDPDIELGERAREDIGKKDGVEVDVTEVSVRECHPGGMEASVLSSDSVSTEADRRAESNCSVCLEDFLEGEDIRLLPCEHKFHPKCVDPWLETVSGTCPTCRYDLTTPQVVNVEATP